MTKPKEYLEVHRDIGLAYWVDKKTKKITGISEIKKLNFELIEKDGIEIRYYD